MAPKVVATWKVPMGLSMRAELLLLAADSTQNEVFFTDFHTTSRGGRLVMYDVLIPHSREYNVQRKAQRPVSKRFIEKGKIIRVRVRSLELLFHPELTMSKDSGSS